MPLVRGRYGTVNPLWGYIGQINNATQANLPARSNMDVFGLAGLTDQAAALTTAVCTTTGIPVQNGDVISKVWVRTGATAAGTPLNSWAALYFGAGGGALITQSTDAATGAIGASGSRSFTLNTPVLITPTNAPSGFIYVSLMVKATTVPSLAAWTLPTAIGLGPGGGTTSAFTQTNGSALTDTAPATCGGGSLQAAVPLVWLT